MGIVTHEAYISSVAEIAKARLNDQERAIVDSIKLVYGAGDAGLRGVTYYNKWNGKGQDKPIPFVEVCAFGQDSWVQLAGTTLHELGHVLAGWDAGHAKPWHEACGKLGLRRIKAAGTEYKFAMFAPDIRDKIANLPRPDDGEPVKSLVGPSGRPIKLKPCPMGIGTRGGKSRGAGSGSRLRLWSCECPKPVKARVASDTFDATCNCCHAAFHLVQAS